MLQWKDFYSVNIREFDQQHRKMVEMINELEAAMLSGRGKDALHGIYAGLVEYTKVHFVTEERLMRAHQFPGHGLHEAEHAQLTSQVLSFQQQHFEGKGGLTVMTITFLCDWLTHHILITDKKYSAFLNARGVF